MLHYPTTTQCRCQGYTASSLIINFRVHKLQPLLFRISDTIWVGTPCFHSTFITVSRAASTCSERREQNWSMKSATRHFFHLAMHDLLLLDMVLVGGWYWCRSIIFFLRCTMFSAGSPPNTTSPHTSYLAYTARPMCDSIAGSYYAQITFPSLYNPSGHKGKLFMICNYVFQIR